MFIYIKATAQKNLKEEEKGLEDLSPVGRENLIKTRFNYLYQGQMDNLVTSI